MPLTKPVPETNWSAKDSLGFGVWRQHVPQVAMRHRATADNHASLQRLYDQRQVLIGGLMRRMQAPHHAGSTLRDAHWVKRQLWRRHSTDRSETNFIARDANGIFYRESGGFIATATPVRTFSKGGASVSDLPNPVMTSGATATQVAAAAEIDTAINSSTPSSAMILNRSGMSSRDATPQQSQLFRQKAAAKGPPVEVPVLLTPQSPAMQFLKPAPLLRQEVFSGAAKSIDRTSDPSIDDVKENGPVAASDRHGVINTEISREVLLPLRSTSALSANRRLYPSSGASGLAASFDTPRLAATHAAQSSSSSQRLDQFATFGVSPTSPAKVVLASNTASAAERASHGSVSRAVDVLVSASRKIERADDVTTSKPVLASPFLEIRPSNIVRPAGNLPVLRATDMQLGAVFAHENNRIDSATVSGNGLNPALDAGSLVLTRAASNTPTTAQPANDLPLVRATNLEPQPHSIAREEIGDTFFDASAGQMPSTTADVFDSRGVAARGRGQIIESATPASRPELTLISRAQLGGAHRQTSEEAGSGALLAASLPIFRKPGGTYSLLPANQTSANLHLASAGEMPLVQRKPLITGGDESRLSGSLLASRSSGAGESLTVTKADFSRRAASPSNYSASASASASADVAAPASRCMRAGGEGSDVVPILRIASSPYIASSPIARAAFANARFGQSTYRFNPAPVLQRSNMSRQSDLPLVLARTGPSRSDTVADRSATVLPIETVSAANSAPVGGGASAVGSVASAPGQAIDCEEIAERAWQLLLDRMEIERERRGFSPWS